MESYNKITCELYCFSDVEHLQQIYVGYNMLHYKGAIRAHQNIIQKNLFDEEKPTHLRNSKNTHLKVILNKKTVLYYDLHDSYEIDADVLKDVDFYFKRSFSEKTITNEELKKKIFPLGLNYCTFDSRFDLNLIKRSSLYNGFNGIKNILRGLNIDSLYFKKLYTPRIRDFEYYPALNDEPKILFMCRTWDPSIGGSNQKYYEIEKINETRAQCIRALKKEFGGKFFGGFANDEYSRSHYRDCVINNKNITRKMEYMTLLKSYPICIATTGLHGSIGWKMAEYVAYSKAIVTEPLLYKVTGNFEIGENYLEFKNPEECIESVIKLLNDSNLRSNIMMNNYMYYNNYVRPDSIVLNTINTAIHCQ